ncbi:MAG: murein L,D-transpeptidase [Methylobacterium mesophilicum]|nr:murein L,D-transpeptidase [Methylobacterium mesophilicum]
MKRSVARAVLLAATLALAGCTEQVLEDYSTTGGKELNEKILARMKARDMKPSSPIMVRIFKEEGKLEVWKAKTNGRYDLISMYNICRYSGKLGPKFIEGDRQAPEGFYEVKPGQMNPNSQYRLAFNIGFPNAYDRAYGRTGQNLMVHGACSSSGCYSMTDPQVEEIFALGREAFKGGQTDFQVQAFPFRMTAANMARYKDDPNYAFWKNLKEGYDQFEITKVPPKVDVCEKRYVFNMTPEPGKSFSATGACPVSSQPEALQTAFKSYQSGYDTAFNAALNKGGKTPITPSISGIQEANLVADWTKRRARGERIPIDPPSMQPDGSVVVTQRMGRIDSPAGRQMAEAEAAAAAKKKAEQEKAMAVAAAKAEKEAAKLAAAQAAAQPVVQVSAQPDAAAAPLAVATPEQEGTVARLKKRFSSILGN